MKNLTVEAYFAALPEDRRRALEALRQIIKETLASSPAPPPGASPVSPLGAFQEVISYRIPTFKYQGYLVAITAQKNHLSLHTMSKALMSAMKDDLAHLDKTVASVHFPYDKPLPKSLIARIIRHRMKENEERMRNKKK